MKPALLQLQVPEGFERFRRVLVYGAPEAAIALLTQALPLIGRGADLHVASVAGGSGAAERSLRALLDRLRRGGLRVTRDEPSRMDAAFLGRRAATRPDLVLKALAAGPPGQAAFDAHDRRLLATGGCVAWFGRGGGRVIPRRIAVACDASEEGTLPAARRALTLADALAAATGAELYVAFAWDAFRAELVDGRADVAIVGERIPRGCAAPEPAHAAEAIRKARGSVVVVTDSWDDERSAG
jgi:hypothetical protein